MIKMWLGSRMLGALTLTWFCDYCQIMNRPLGCLGRWFCCCCCCLCCVLCGSVRNLGRNMSHSLMEGHEVVCWLSAWCAEGSVVIKSALMTHTTCTHVRNTHTDTSDSYTAGVSRIGRNPLSWPSHRNVSHFYWSSHMGFDQCSLQRLFDSPPYIENDFQHCSLWGWRHTDIG